MSTRRSGFTLLEIVLVLAIILMLGALAAPTLFVMYEQEKVTAAADTYRAALATARSRAIEEGQPYRVCVVPGKGNLCVAPDMDSAWGGGNPTDASGNPIFVHEVTLSKGISLSLADAPQRPDAHGETALALGTVGTEMWKTVAVMLPDGSARDSSEVLVLPIKGRGLVVALRALTGESSVRRAPVGGI
jgi:prepilin-type N-terminal cleavage/methylation domain-containing protein